MLLRQRILATALLGLGATAAMAADKAGWYGGINVGRRDFRQNDGGVDSALANQGITASSSTDSKDTGYGFDLGYQFNPNFALEGGYVDLGKSKFNSNVTAPLPGTADGRVKARGLTFSALGIVPLRNDFSLYGRLGLIHAKTEFEASGSPGVAISGTSETKTRGLYGVGLNYDITKSLATRVEWTRYAKLGDVSTTKGDVDLYSVGLNVKF